MIQRQIFEFWGLFGFYQEYCANILCIQIQNEFHHYTIHESHTQDWIYVIRIVHWVMYNISC